MKIAVYAISKNEEQFVEQFCNSAKDADLILIADTGSTDNTIALAQKHGAMVHSISITPWRFDEARNIALSLVPPEYDICISLDLDEVLEHGWREEIETVWTKDTNILQYYYTWMPGITFAYEKIHSRQGYVWNSPCHEMNIPDMQTTPMYAYTDKVLVKHFPDLTKDRSSYIELVDLAIKENNLTIPMQVFLYGWEYTRNQQWQKAIDVLNYYLNMPNITCCFEKSRAMQFLAKSYEALGDTGSAKLWYQTATQEAPDAREAWCELSGFLLRQNEVEDAYSCAITALSISKRQRTHATNPSVWAEVPHHYAALAAYRLGMLQDALRHCEAALEAAPDKHYIREDLFKIKSEIG